MLEHWHPLKLRDLWLEQLQLEENYDEDEEKDENELIAEQDRQCLCLYCDEEIKLIHRYCYTCSQCRNYSIHIFCSKLPEKIQDTCHDHTLYLRHGEYAYFHSCSICRSNRKSYDPRYSCSQCAFDIDVKCATKLLQKNIIYHPSHAHSLVCMSKQITCECNACGEEHKGTFYRCLMCPNLFIHEHCAFLPEKLQIQHVTNNHFSHVHPLNLSYSFPKADQESKFHPLCRVCRRPFDFVNLWFYKCDKCRYYTHLNCATSRNEPFMSILASPGTGKIIKNYKDAEHPDLLHLPFPDASYSILRHLFFKKNGPCVIETKAATKTHISHQHPLVLEDAKCTNDITSPAYSRIKSISYHDPMKKIELLCDACIRPIMSGPIYVCANEEEHCNFVLHEWCSRLPTKLKGHPYRPQHTLVLHSKVPDEVCGVFKCETCRFYCNGFAYCCKECEDYNIDVKCAFIPKEVTHTSHPNHLLSRVFIDKARYDCYICGKYMYLDYEFSCYVCDFHIHAVCAMLIPETTTIKCDKHPIKLSYSPIENHESEYFCEVCEEEINPELSFYHCHECIQSMHTACAPSILRYDTHMSGDPRSIPYYVNMKFGETYINLEMHPHPLSFVQGLESDGKCTNCLYSFKNGMIFKCINCGFAIDFWCLSYFAKRHKRL